MVPVAVEGSPTGKLRLQCNLPALSVILIAPVSEEPWVAGKGINMLVGNEPL
jgi:hypothetical protein